MDRKRTTFAIEYFNFNNRIYDYVNFIMWLSMFFKREKGILLCGDKNHEDTLILSSDISIEQLEKWLQKSGI